MAPTWAGPGLFVFHTPCEADGRGIGPSNPQFVMIMKYTYSIFWHTPFNVNKPGTALRRITPLHFLKTAELTASTYQTWNPLF